MTEALEQSFKKRLQLIAKERNLTPAEVWQNVIAERFLVRLCKSSYHSHFILKGGTLLAKYIELGRETQDLDFAMKYFSNELDVLQKVFDTIVEIEVDDGFIFKKPNVVLLDHFHMMYSGSQVKIEVHFGKARFPLFIDLGFGDEVDVHEQKILLLSNSKGPLFEPTISVKAYPIEFIFAEKLETVIYRGSKNSRMKDFHDLYTMVLTKEAIDGNKIEKAIAAVFRHRKTPIQLPIKFDAEAFQALQNYWSKYYRTAKVMSNLPSQVEQVVEAINEGLNVKMDLRNFYALRWTEGA